jgi:phosphopantothenoylcysteine decarboxylase/phosphopantothenate--cysteine ligase
MKGKNIVVGVTGGIAAYKAADIVNKLQHMGANVFVIMTKNACEFITPLTFETLSRNLVVTDMFADKKSWEVEHISLAQKADLFLIAPATANFIGNVANGLMDDMLSTTIAATKATVVFAPAMNDGMYTNPIVQANISKLKDYGYEFISPEVGNLACGYVGVGKLAKVDTIVDYVKNKFEKECQ